jgi:hypothetical protein
MCAGIKATLLKLEPLRSPWSGDGGALRYA